MNKLFKVSMILMVFAVLSAPNSAPATPLYNFVGDCGSVSANCFGSTYTLIIDDANDATNTTYGATLIINTTGYNGPGAYIDSVDIKVVNRLINNTYSLVTAPGGTQNWQSFFSNGQAATNCGAGGGFSLCANANALTSAPVTAGILTWGWTFSSSNPISFGHIGASYNNELGTINGNNTSISTPLDAPATFMLLGGGLVLLSGVARKFGPRK